MSKVFFATPLYDGRLQFTAARAMLSTASKRHAVIGEPFVGSLLTDNCTRAWVEALNRRDVDPELRWFAMLHDDI